MISIKVCRLSDLINKTLVMVISGIVIVTTCNMILNIISEFSFELIKYSLNKNICTVSDDKIFENIISMSFPSNLSNSKDDIEKEFNLADNISDNKIKNSLIWKNKDDKQNSESAVDNNDIGNSKSNFNQYNSMENTIKVAPPYLLKCEKISDSKYKIGSIIINDYTKKKLDLSELEKSLFTEVEKDCKVLIYHTHTSESYTGVENYSDMYRTEDSNSNVVKVGETLKNQLNNFGFYVRHDKTIHDYPSYNGAYKSSLKTVQNILENENYDIIIDVHRDALASNSNYRPTAEINGETVAKLMFVVGTNTAGLKHDNWIQNLKFAIAVQQRAEEMYPGLFRDLHLSTSRYNQHTSNKSVILEVGATGNSIDEACLAMKYLASVLNTMRQ